MSSVFSELSSFAFKPGEKVDRGFVRVLGRLAIQARRIRQHAHGNLSESIHNTRVLIKWLRALLWFASPALSSSEINRAKSHLRKAAHLLAAQRELDVMQSMLENLPRKTANSAHRKALARIANTLGSQQAITEKPDQSLQQAVAILLTTTKQIERRARIKSGWPSASERLAQAFRATEKSGKKALNSEDAAQFHDWRKKAKRLLYLLRLTQASPGKHMTHTIKQVAELQEKLGAYHDCVIAQDRLRKHVPHGIPLPAVRRIEDLLERRKDRLRKEVRKIARHIMSGYSLAAGRA